MAMNRVSWNNRINDRVPLFPIDTIFSGQRSTLMVDSFSWSGRTGARQARMSKNMFLQVERENFK